MVRRYWPENGYDSVMRECATMKESPHGAYVDYADYRELAKRCEKLEAALRDMVDRITYYAELKEDGIPNIEDWAYTYSSGDMKRAREALSTGATQ